MKILSLQFWTEFHTPSGEVRELKDPEAPATPRQLSRLNQAGMICVVSPGESRVLTKGEAAYAVSLVHYSEAVAGERPTRWGFN